MSEPKTESPIHNKQDDEKETRFGWAYLAVLLAIFLLIALSTYSCGSRNETTAGDETTTTSAAATGDLTPVALTATIADGHVTLTGAVTDEAARDQIVMIAEDRYGAGNVTDELTIDSGTTLAGGTMTVVGETFADDPKPDDLFTDFSTAFGWTDAGSSVDYKEIVLTPYAASAVVATDQVTLSGEMPDQDSLDALVAASEEIWGAENVDSSGLTLGTDLTRDNGTVTVSGLVDAGDTRVGAYESALAAGLGGTSIDISGVDIDTSAAALKRAQDNLTAAVALEPILFATGSAEIDAASDSILQRTAEAINAAPGINITVVGHTDDQGSSGVNQLLSADRAKSVVDRLVELGVDAERLTSRGDGEDNPIEDNTTEEGRAANRRIAFEFEGAEGE